MAVRAIDCWVNVNMSDLGRPAYLEQVATNYFKQGEDFFRDYSIEETLKLMDRVGVEKAILTTSPEKPQPHVLSFAEKRPERFALGAQLDPRRGMDHVRALESFHRDHNVVLARITPFYIDVPPGDAMYYPFYTKCVELDLPISINTGIPGPPAPGEESTARRYSTVVDASRYWSTHNGCVKHDRAHDTPNAGVIVDTWYGCDENATVQLLTLTDWGHRWPGEYFTSESKYSNGYYGFDAARIIWTFFQRHTRNLQDV